ncbi:bifunctional phosphoribosyl-AMP cyclohydrolase/phosphoribosyl-ATP diphosphatase HisIE [Candidatus Deianiraea vastatrix]|uniref:Histidine biosynthesis bifunctional protein HisIE n=1 Tax=Candidatus Deianiraea vastatrix TaxID=2163644 RepID=A0A5B8XHT1_9RICK|nr:bifunctional phosphoribosyl-AMP cyclohydrolase/phosphoribosyl-ATP diphosphatase HisIE [Candidatus Deianiraea vastatrix]QED23621.1 Phosphoribosyl-ATP pyrophosphatase [Candidatus Deianiraea vastatrix]
MIEKIDWQKCNNLIPSVIQDAKTLDVLMLGFMTIEALNLTISTNKVHFWSRTKNRIWMKGEDSGNILRLENIHLDCDGDSLLILVNPVGNTCHNGTKSCFNYKANFLSQLEEIIDDRVKNQVDESYISSMQKKGINKIAQKVGEEATEVIIAALNEKDVDFIGECADLVFHLMLLLKYKNLTFNHVISKMKERDKRKLKDENYEK